MNEQDCLDAAGRCFFDGVGSATHIMNTLAQSEWDHAKAMANLIKVDPGFFLRRTQEVLDENMGREAPQVDIPP